MNIMERQVREFLDKEGIATLVVIAFTILFTILCSHSVYVATAKWHWIIRIVLTLLTVSWSFFLSVLGAIIILYPKNEECDGLNMG